MPNFFAEFRKLLAPGAQEIATVVAYADGVATVEGLDGGRYRAKGETQVGAKVFTQDGVILGPAPDLPVIVSEI